MKNHWNAALRINILVALIEGMYMTRRYVLIPSEAHSAALWGYSIPRLALLSLLGFIFVALFLLFMDLTPPIQKVGKKLRASVKHAQAFWVLLLWLGLIYLILFLSDHTLGSLASYREFLYPLFSWLGLVSLQLFVSYIVTCSIEMDVLREYRGIFIPMGIAVALLAIVIGGIAITGIGLKPDIVYWQNVGVPILFSQVILATLTGVLIHYAEIQYIALRSNRLTILMALTIWLVACLLWLGQPLAPSYNSLKPVSPNYQSYPFGDALQYDVTAHEFLAGKQIPGDYWSKPLYSLFLTLLHLVGGEDYNLLVSLQITVLAVIPVFVYLIASHLGNRPAGVVAALLVILRESNGIALSNVIQVSNVKLLMSDVFTMGLVSVLILLTLDWLRKAHAGKLLLMGCTLGLLVLTRGHPIILFPFILCVVFFASKVQPIFRWKYMLLYTLGFFITLLPWLTRISLETGEFSFQAPGSPYASQMAELYSHTPSVISREKVEARLPGETDLAFSKRMNQRVFEFMLHHPLEVARFVSAHFFHNAIIGYIYLPHSLELESLHTYVTTEPFWKQWSGSLHSYNWLFLGLNILLLGLGTGVMWKKNRYDALAPVIIGIGYNLSVSAGRLSGWRFIQPSDWIILIYYSVGLMQLFFIFKFLTSRARNLNTSSETADISVKPHGLSIWNGVGLLIPFLLISIFLTWGHKLFLNHFSNKTENELISALENASPNIQHEDLKDFLLSEDATILSGESLYPIFWEANSGILNYFWTGYSSKSYSRLGFYLLGQKSSYVLLPIQSPPSNFPDGSEVVVLGCKTIEGDIKALAVLLEIDPLILFLSDPFPGWRCPVSQP